VGHFVGHGDCGVTATATATRRMNRDEGVNSGACAGARRTGPGPSLKSFQVGNHLTRA
jgi:hypothetical protein